MGGRPGLKARARKLRRTGHRLVRAALLAALWLWGLAAIVAVSEVWLRYQHPYSILTLWYPGALAAALLIALALIAPELVPGTYESKRGFGPNRPLLDALLPATLAIGCTVSARVAAFGLIPIGFGPAPEARDLSGVWLNPTYALFAWVVTVLVFALILARHNAAARRS